MFLYTLDTSLNHNFTFFTQSHYADTEYARNHVSISVCSSCQENSEIVFFNDPAKPRESIVVHMFLGYQLLRLEPEGFHPTKLHQPPAGGGGGGGGGGEWNQPQTQHNNLIPRTTTSLVAKIILTIVASIAHRANTKSNWQMLHECGGGNSHRAPVCKTTENIMILY